MILLLFAAVGLAAGLLAGGRIRHIKSYPLRGLLLPVCALLLKAGASYILRPQNGAVLVCIAQYGLLFAFLLLNRTLRIWPAVTFAGVTMNFLVILLNGGCMPVAVGLLKSGSERTAQLAAGQIYAYTAVSADTVLPFLGDVLSIAPRGMTIGFASPGDLVLCAGVGLLCFQMTRDTGGGRENGVPGKDSEAEAKS